MALNTGSSKLNLGLKTLRCCWEDTRQHWKDPVGQSFEELHLTPFELQILSTLRAIDELARVLSQAERECR